MRLAEVRLSYAVCQDASAIAKKRRVLRYSLLMLFISLVLWFRFEILQPRASSLDYHFYAALFQEVAGALTFLWAGEIIEVELLVQVFIYHVHYPRILSVTQCVQISKSEYFEHIVS